MRLIKINRNTFFGFCLGFLAAIALVAGLSFSGHEAEAGQYTCIRTSLEAKGMTGNIPEPAFTITYDVPACYSTNGYSVSRVYMYGDQVAIHYSNQQ